MALNSPAVTQSDLAFVPHPPHPVPASRVLEKAGLHHRVRTDRKTLTSNAKTPQHINMKKNLLTSAPWAPRPGRLSVRTCAAGVDAASGPRQPAQHCTSAVAVHEDQLHT